MKSSGVLCGLVAALLCLGATVAFSRQPQGSLRDTGPAPAAKAESIDELVTALDAIRAQKAALEKAEQEMVSRIKEKLQQQNQRLRKAGLIRDEADTPGTTYFHPTASSGGGEAGKEK